MDALVIAVAMEPIEAAMSFREAVAGDRTASFGAATAWTTSLAAMRSVADARALF